MPALFCLHRLLPWLWKSDPVVMKLKAQRAEVDRKITDEIRDINAEIRLLSEMLNRGDGRRKERVKHGP